MPAPMGSRSSPSGVACRAAEANADCSFAATSPLELRPADGSEAVAPPSPKAKTATTTSRSTNRILINWIRAWHSPRRRIADLFRHEMPVKRLCYALAVEGCADDSAGISRAFARRIQPPEVGRLERIVDSRDPHWTASA